MKLETGRVCEKVFEVMWNEEIKIFVETEGLRTDKRRLRNANTLRALSMCTLRQKINKKLISASDGIKSPSKLWKFPLLRNAVQHFGIFMPVGMAQSRSRLHVGTCSVEHRQSTVVEGSVRFSRCFWRSSARALMK